MPQDETPPVALIRALATELTSRHSYAVKGGLTFGGKRDLFGALGYKNIVTLQDYRARYQRNAIASRIIEALPKATWRGGGELIEDDDPDVETKFEAAWKSLDDRLGVWSTFLRADILAGLGQYSVILIGAPGDLSQELPKVKGPDGIAYLTPFSQEDVAVKEVVEDQEDQRFGLPLIYQFNRISVSSRQQVTSSRLVHWTRVHHIADGLLDDPINGKPRLECVWNLLDDLDKVSGAGAEAFWLRAHQGYVAEIDKDAEVDNAEMEAMKQQVEEFSNQIRRTIGLRGATFKAMGSDVANIGQNVDAIIQLISGGCEIPKRILTGSEMGELASTQDTANWNVRVLDRRHEFAGPHVVRPLVNRLISVGALPQADYEVRWPEMEHLSEQERAAIAVQWASANATMGATVVTADEIRDRVLLLPPLSEVAPAAGQAVGQPGAAPGGVGAPGQAASGSSGTAPAATPGEPAGGPPVKAARAWKTLTTRSTAASQRLRLARGR